MLSIHPISPDMARRHAQETLAISERGHYHAPSGRLVNLQAQIERAVRQTIAYPPTLSLETTWTGDHRTGIEVTNETTLSAAARLTRQGFKTVALNFASATDPGGAFLKGARAQEEYLCRSSCLYPCLRRQPMYDFHARQNDPFHTDYVIYSPAVPVIRGDDGALLEYPVAVSFLTASAVHAERAPPARQSEINPAMWSRILKVLAVGCTHGHDAIVLGAWGCGAFGNDPEAIASLFKKALTEHFNGAYRSVVFAILDQSGDKESIGPFERALNSQHLD